MILHPQIDSLLRTMGGLQDDGSDDAAAFRARYQRWSAAMPVSADAVPVRFGDFSLGTRHGTRLAARMYLPEDQPQPRPMVFFHGGHGLAGSIETHHELCLDLCRRLKVGLVCASMPALDVHGWTHLQECAQDVLLLAHGKRAELKLSDQPMWAGGDGTGALLCWQAARHCALDGRLAVQAALLLYPYTKPDLGTPSQLVNVHAPALNRVTIGRAWSALLGSPWHAWRPDLVPFHAPLDSLALVPSMVAAAQCDALHDDGMHLHDLIANNGGAALFRGVPNMPHDFARMAAASEQVRSFMGQLCDDFSAFAAAQPTPAA
jgi:acetyl esterase